MFLFVGTTIVSASNLIFWLIISQIVSPAEIGQATTIISLVLLIGFFCGLGLEFPLLKFSSKKNRILGTTLGIEFLALLICIPILAIVINYSMNEALHQFTLLAILLLSFSSVAFLLRFSLLGISQAKKVFFIDMIGNGAKLLLGYFLATAGFGVSAILISMLAVQLVTVFVILRISGKRFGFKLGDIKLIKEIINLGTSNLPNNFSRMVILSLTVVLLAFFGVSESEIGIFYIALMITMVARIFANSAAYMVIPSSSTSQKDLSNLSTRIGLSLTSPIVVLLLTIPGPILALVGDQYLEAETVLFVLSLSIIPYVVIVNIISSMNNLNKLKEMILIGTIQAGSLLIAFWFVVPQMGIIGGALAILISSLSALAVSLKWSERFVFRYAGISGISIIAGWFVGYIVSLLIGNTILEALFAVISTFVLTFALGGISFSELKYLLNSIVKNQKSRNSSSE